MALTEIPSELSSTPSIVDNGNGTAITIDAGAVELTGPSGAGETFLNFTADSNTTKAQISAAKAGASGGRLVFSTTNSSGALTEAFRVDQSSNFLVGKTTTAFGTAGIALRGTVADFIRDGGTPINVNRLTDNGSLIDLHKNSLLVGSISTAVNDLNIDGAANHSGIRFQQSSILPRLNGADTDGTTDLGYRDGSLLRRWREGFFSSNLNIINPSEDERGLKIEDEQDGGQNLQFLYNASTNNGRIINDNVDQIRFDGANGLSVNTPSFCAYVTSDIATATGANQISFGTQITDTAGGHYNTGNSRFYAPRDGTYFFSTSITYVNGNGVDDTMYVTYYVNGVTSALRQFQDNWRGRSGGGIEGQSTYSMVIPLSANDYVTVVYSGIADNSIIIRGTYSKFSGFALSLT